MPAPLHLVGGGGWVGRHGGHGESSGGVAVDDCGGGGEGILGATVMDHGWRMACGAVSSWCAWCVLWWAG